MAVRRVAYIGSNSVSWRGDSAVGSRAWQGHVSLQWPLPPLTFHTKSLLFYYYMYYNCSIQLDLLIRGTV